MAACARWRAPEPWQDSLDASQACMCTMVSSTEDAEMPALWQRAHAC